MKRGTGESRAGRRSSQSKWRRLDCVARKGQGQTTRADSDAALRKEIPQPVHSPADAFLSGIFGSAQRLADVAQITVLEVPEQDCAALGRFQAVHGFFQQGFDLL